MIDLHSAAVPSVLKTEEEATQTVAVTPMQRRLLLQHQLLPKDGSFNLAYAFRIERDSVDLPRLAGCFRQVLDACIGLNTSFQAGPEGPVALVRSSGHGPSLSELGDHPDADSEQQAVIGWLAERADLPIPPDRWPLYDFTLHVGKNAVYLTMLSSHLVGDAYTYYNLIEKVKQLYADAESWSRIAHELGQHPALVTIADTESGVDLGVSTFRNLLSEVSALGHQALAVDRTKQEVLQGVSPRIQLPAELATDLRDGAAIRRHGPFAVFLATYAVVLARLTGRADVVVGVPLANRRKARERQAFGYFVNTLPMPLNLAAHKTFEDLVATVAARVFTLLRHQQFDLGAHADAIFGRAPAGPVAVDNAFTFYKQRFAPEFDGRQTQAIAVPRTLIKYPFGMNVEDQGDGYLVNLEYLPRLSAADPAACVLQVLGTVAADPAVCLADLAILSPDREQALVDLAGTAKDFDTPASLDAWFRSAAAGRPDAAAVCDPEGTLSYADLDAAADRVASNLRILTSGPAVAVAMHRSRHLVAVILGVLRAGMCYVPIDPAAPPERARHIVGQFDDLLLVSDHAALAAVDGIRRVDSSEVLSEIDHPAERAPAPAEDLDSKDFRDKIAYVIFTSGSTGVPKGVEVTHRNVMRLFRSAEEHFDFGPQDTWCLFHSYAFDFSVWEIFGALLYGGRLVVVPELTARSPDMFADLLVREKVTVLNQTPSAFRRLTSVLGPRADLAVRWIIFGGEALHVDILQPWLAAHPSSARLVNMYGITETTVHVTFHEVDPATVGTQSESVIGRALGDLTVTVVDRDLNRCPVGVQGEILVSGAGLARGYRNRPDLTAERFLRGTRYGEVVYRTGDLGVLRADGTLVYLGRIDKQVQLRGYRIELGEVEAGLLAVAGVRECAVTLDEPRGGEPRLVAYVVGENIPDSHIRAELSRRLPSYMMPAVFVRIDAIPLTVNGKVDEKQLPAPVVAAAVTAPEGSDELARSVARVWAEVVQTGPVGVNDNFFDIGGTSMHVAEVHRRLTTDLGAQGLAMIELFEFPTPSTLADRIRPAIAGPPTAAVEFRSRPRAARPARPARAGTLRRLPVVPNESQEEAS